MLLRLESFSVCSYSSVRMDVNNISICILATHDVKYVRHFIIANVLGRINLSIVGQRKNHAYA